MGPPIPSTTSCHMEPLSQVAVCKFPEGLAERAGVGWQASVTWPWGVGGQKAPINKMLVSEIWYIPLGMCFRTNYFTNKALNH